jgi:precorrin-6B methylase 2
MRDVIFLLILFVPIAGLLYFKKIRPALIRHHFQKIRKEINTLYADVNPFKVSIESRQLHPHFNKEEFVYGEIEILTLLALCRKISPRKKQVFYDLGSGSGKVAIAVKLCYPTLVVKGIEILPELLQLASLKWQSFVKKHPKLFTAQDIEFIGADITEVSFQDADIIFINATSFSPDTWQKIISKLSELKKGSKILITTKQLPITTFQPLYVGSELMSWGFTTTSLYEKIR